jgi:hypothetical protein
MCAIVPSDLAHFAEFSVARPHFLSTFHTSGPLEHFQISLRHASATLMSRNSLCEVSTTMPLTKQTIQQNLQTSPRFTPFPQLPIEIRQLIWHLTLEPRVVEIIFTDNGGFVSATACPVTLKVNRDSRASVIKSYPFCFGLSWYPLRTRFNFTLDTLYFRQDMMRHIPIFFSFLQHDEITKIRYLAIDMAMLSEWDQIRYPETQTLFLERLEKAVKRMTSLKEMIEVYTLTSWARHCKHSCPPQTWDLEAGTHHPRPADCRMEFLEQLPPELLDPELDVDPNLPKHSVHFQDWELPKLRLVFGRRKKWIFEAESLRRPGPGRKQRRIRFFTHFP